MSDQVTITIDGQPQRVDAGSNLLQACLSLQQDLPYFCWHPAMGSVGSCRLCAMTQYQNAADERGRLVMACMTPVSDGMIVSMNNEKSTTFRATTIEAIMTNHPHDCPVCEEGGDCHLQDMTLLSGHIKRRYPGTKRTHLNQYLGPFLNHEMNRCIGCYRCVRFYRDYCGGTDLNVFASRNQIYFGRAESGVLENEFAGNLAEVCPTGVFTDKPFGKHFIRKWDLQSAPSVCTGCSVGCNIYSAERNGVLRKLSNRYNPQVNGHFICDRGRFGYQYVNHAQRLEQPWRRNNQNQQTDVLAAKAAEQLLTDWISHGDCIAVGSGRSSLENNAALFKLAGKKHFYAGVNDAQIQQLTLLADSYQHSGLRRLSLAQIETCDALLLVGEDPTHTAPRLALSIRQMSRNAGIEKAAKLGIKPWQDEAVRNIAQDTRSPLFIVNTHSTGLADVAKQNLLLAPAQQLALMLALEAVLLARLDPQSAQQSDRQDQQQDKAAVDSDADADAIVQALADALLLAKQPALVTGSNSDQPELLATCLRIALLLQQHNADSGFYCANAEANSLALGMLCLPDSHREDKHGEDKQSRGLDSLLQRLAQQPPSTLIVMETDLYRYFSEAQLNPLLDKIEHIIVLDQLLTRTAQAADLLLPVASFAETQGCWLNAEGRAQQSFATLPTAKARFSGFQWLQSLTGLYTHDQLLQWCADSFDSLAPLTRFIHDSDADFTIARQPLRASARTAIHAGVDVKEYPPAKDTVSPLAFSMEGVPAFRQKMLPQLKTPITGVWSPKWNSGQAINRSLETEDGSDGDDNHGIRLWNPTAGTAQGQRLIGSRLAPSPEPQSIPKDHIRLAPRHHIYADDELAGYADTLSALIPPSRASLSPAQAAALKLGCGAVISLSNDKTRLELPCVIDAKVADGVILLPLQAFFQLGYSAQIETVKETADE